LEMKEDDFLQNLSKNTRKGYKTGLRKFEQYFGKSVDETLKLREQDLVQMIYIKSARP
jgi:site-specific recombinase XerD